MTLLFRVANGGLLAVAITAVKLSECDDRLQQLNHASANDPVLQVLRETIRCGWPERKSDVPESIHAYYDCRDELTLLVFKGQCLVISAAMRGM